MTEKKYNMEMKNLSPSQQSKIRVKKKKKKRDQLESRLRCQLHQLLCEDFMGDSAESLTEV